MSNNNIKRRLCRLAAFIMCVLCTLTSVFAEPLQETAKDGTGSYVRTLFNEQNGLPTGEANTIIQSSDGYIWIGSYGGLIRYDGSTFRNYSTEKSIPSSSIRSLFEDSKGRLWIGTNDAGVYKYENGIFSAIASPDDFSFLCIRDFAEGLDGKIYIASNSGMGEINEQTSGIEPYSDSALAGETIYSIGCDSTGRIWAAMNSGKCAAVKDKKAEIIDYSDILSSGEVYCLADDRNGNIYLGSSENDIAVLSFDSGGKISSKQYSTGNIYTHNNIKVGSDGTILICGEHGFAVMDEDGSIIMSDNTNQTISTTDACVDYEGNIWFSSSSYGIIKYTKGCMSPFGENTSVSKLAINAVTKSGNEFYIAHDNGLAVISADGREVTNSLTNMLKGIRVRHVFTDSKGIVWLSTYSSYGALSYDPQNKGIKLYNTSNGLISSRVRLVAELSDGAIAFATQEGISIMRDGKVTESYNSSNGMSIESILCMAEDADGTLYMGSDGSGIYALKDGKITSYSFNEGLEEGVVLRMIHDSDSPGSYFISAGNNLYYWDKQSFKKLENFTKSAGSIFDLYDRDGKLWLLQHMGGFSVNKEKLLSGEPVKTVKYSFEHGLTGSLNANTWNYMDESGHLYLTTRQGISVFGFEGTDNPLPEVSINGISIDGEVYDKSAIPDIPGKAQRITIDFAVLSYTGNSSFETAYSLEGFDEEETILSDSKSDKVSYTNLPGGDYTFIARVYDPEDPENEHAAAIVFHKKKLFYEYPLFKAFLVIALMLLAGAAVFLIAAARLKVLHKRQEEYRQIVEQSLECFAETIDAKDKYTNGHSLRVAEYSRELAKRMGMSEAEQERIYYIALLHDIGKIGVPDSILNKPGKLTDEEMDVIRTHPAIGGKILKSFTAIEGIAQGAKYHHERYDGNGYCEKIAGEDIPLEARIIGVADTYDAMSSNRCYRRVLPREVIEAELRRVSGTQLDPNIVPHMLDMIEDGTAPVNTTSDINSILEGKH